jgi:hypothetical protein
MAAKCNTLFCDAERHDDDLHVDVTGHTWHEPLSDTPVIARAYILSAEQ